jgi:hypothetical protein
MDSISPRHLKDLVTLVRFVGFYCNARHDRRQQAEVPLADGLRQRLGTVPRLCPACAELLLHGIGKREVCPLDPKPSCRRCRIHCYSPAYRQQVREVMAFAGPRLILRGRLDYLWHYLLT